MALHRNPVGILAIIALVVGVFATYSAYTTSQAAEELAQSVDRVSGQLSDLSRVLKDTAATVQELSQKLTRLEERTRGIEEGVSSVEEKTRGLEKRIGALEEGLGEVSRSVEEVGRRVDDVSGRLGGVEEELQVARENLSALASQVEDLGLRLAEVEERVAAFEARLEAAAFPLEVSDALGRIVVIPEPPERIVSLAPSITEILFTIGAGDLVVGVDQFSDYPPGVVERVQAGELEVVGGFSTINIEKVVSLRPDLVVGVGGVQLRIVYTLSQLGVTAISLASDTIGDVYNNILLLGKITRHMEEAKELVREIQAGVQGVYLTTTAANTTPSVLFVVWVNPIFAAGGNSWVSDLIGIAGGENALGDLGDSWPMVSWEVVLERNPDVIIFTENAGGLANATQALEWLASQPGSSNVTAVAEGRVYMLHGELSDALQRPGVRLVLAAEALARIIHPELYGLETLPNDLYAEDLGLGG